MQCLKESRQLKFKQLFASISCHKGITITYRRHCSTESQTYQLDNTVNYKEISIREILKYKTQGLRL
jgi:hypothetical protein